MEAGLALAFASGLMGKLGEIALNKASNKLSLLRNFKSDFKWLETHLSQICSSLQAADQLTGHTEGVKKWLEEVRNIAFDAEDIIDECAVEHLYTSIHWVFRYKMGKRIKDLKDRISSAIEEAQRLKLFHDVTHLNQPSTSTSTRGGDLRRWPTIFERDSPAVAIDFKVDEILGLLENPSVGVVAVLGMGGLGKTFLVQHIFDRTKHRYECSAWISVSQTFSLRSLQCDLASQISLQLNESGVTDRLVAQSIHDRLEGKRCLIVLDDMWSRSAEDNLISGLGLPTGRNRQCKIVVTTRNRDVAENVNAHIYEMQHLSDGESWNLFCQYAFLDREGNRPPEKLERLAHQIVGECGRLPLAVKTVGASMAKSSLASDWELKLGQLRKIGKTEDSIMKILKLSYDSLPPNLKTCFAYFSIFPEDTHISFSTIRIERAIYQDFVIYLWIAEGCIPQEEDREKWDIGLNYLQQLENLCLLEVKRGVSCYTVHDLLLDLGVNICKEHGCEFDLPLTETSCRRLLLARKDLDSRVISERPLLSQRFLRTLSLSQNPGIASIPEKLVDHARVLRVIDLSRTAISTLPKCVGKLKLVKVLNLSYTQISEVPKCVRRLKSLQFLDVSHCKVLTRLPDWIGELKLLSHLNVEWCPVHELSNNQMPKGISELLSLRTLRSARFSLSIEENEFLTVKDVANMINLQEIRFRLEDEGALASVEDGILESLVNMRSLAVENATRATTLPTFPEKMKVMKGLQQLHLSCFSVPTWICEMENLTLLSLDSCSDYPSLQKMPNLHSLILYEDSKCRELPKEFGEGGGFPKLAHLEIESFPLLEELPTFEEEAMQRLELLIIKKCPQVKRVGEGLERLRRLKQIQVREASGELEERLKEGGDDWNKIKAHNFRIQIYLD